jgi:hypothetical protein
MNTGTKIALWVTGIAVVGVGSYFIWRSVKKANQKKEDEKKAAEQKASTNNSFGKNFRLIPNTQPKGFMPQSGGINNISLIDKSKVSDIYDKNILGNKTFVYDRTKPDGGLNTTWQPKPYVI